MKSNHHQNPNHSETLGRTGGQIIATRRYPSLSDDGQPWFPRGSWRRPAAATLFPGSHSKMSWVRALSLLAIIILIALLAAAA